MMTTTKMKGLLLAGGTGSRLMPLTKVTNKALLPMGRRPMIYHTLDVLIKAGISDIMVVANPEHTGDVVRLLGSGEELGCKLTYRVQDKPNGIAAALAMCQDFVADNKFAVMLGDNIFEDVNEAANCVKHFGSSELDYGLVIKEVVDPERFGVVSYPKNDREKMQIIEKPAVAPSNDAVLGLYMYKPSVFDVVHDLKPSDRGEYEISHVNNHLVQSSQVGFLYKVKCGWVDAGTHESYERAIDMLRSVNS